MQSVRSIKLEKGNGILNKEATIKPSITLGKKHVPFSVPLKAINRWLHKMSELQGLEEMARIK